MARERPKSDQRERFINLNSTVKTDSVPAPSPESAQAILERGSRVRQTGDVDQASAQASAEVETKADLAQASGTVTESIPGQVAAEAPEQETVAAAPEADLPPDAHEIDVIPPQVPAAAVSDVQAPAPFVPSAESQVPAQADNKVVSGLPQEAGTDAAGDADDDEDDDEASAGGSPKASAPNQSPVPAKPSAPAQTDSTTTTKSEPAKRGGRRQVYTEPPQRVLLRVHTEIDNEVIDIVAARRKGGDRQASANSVYLDWIEMGRLLDGLPDASAAVAAIKAIAEAADKNSAAKVAREFWRALHPQAADSIESVEPAPPAESAVTAETPTA